MFPSQVLFLYSVQCLLHLAECVIVYTVHLFDRLSCTIPYQELRSKRVVNLELHITTCICIYSDPKRYYAAESRAQVEHVHIVNCFVVII